MKRNKKPFTPLLDEHIVLKELDGGVDWEKISSKPALLTDEFIDKYHSKLNFTTMSSVTNWPEKTLDKFFDMFDMEIIVASYNLSQKFILKHKLYLDYPDLVFHCQTLTMTTINKIMKYFEENNITVERSIWRKLLKFQKLSEHFIEKHMDKWDTPFDHQKLSEKFIDKYSDKFFKQSSIEEQSVSEKFVIKYIDKIVLHHLSDSTLRRLSLNFIDTHLQKLNKYNLLGARKLPLWFIEKHWDVFYEYLNCVVREQHLPVSFLDRNMYRIKPSEYYHIIEHGKLSVWFIEKYFSKYTRCMELAIKYQNLPERFIRKYPQYINSHIASPTYSISDELIQDFQCAINLKMLLRHRNVPEYMLRKICNEDTIENIIKFQTMPMDMIENYCKSIDKMNVEIIKLIQYYQKLSSGFIERYFKHIDWIYLLSFNKIPNNFLLKNHDRISMAILNNL